MVKDLKILTDVVLRSILTSLALSQGILAVVLKGMSFATSCLTQRKVRFIDEPLQEHQRNLDHAQ
jgi:hypothetical protein